RTRRSRMGRSSCLGLARASLTILAALSIVAPAHAGWQALTNSSGLAGDFVWNGFQSPADASYWFATTQGLSRYDGLRWKTIEPGASIGDAVHDSTGGLWLFDSPELKRFDGVTWRTFTRDDGLLATDIRDLDVAPDGRVWVAASRYVSVWD